MPILENKMAFTLDEVDPFILILIIPKIGRALMPVRNDPFDAQVRRFDEGRDLLVGGRWKDCFKQVHIKSPNAVDVRPQLHHNTAARGPAMDARKGSD